MLLLALTKGFIWYYSSKLATSIFFKNKNIQIKIACIGFCYGFINCYKYYK